MSVSDNKSISEIADEYWHNYPQYHNPEKRTELFRLIKSGLDKKDSANLRALHRALRKLYDEDRRLRLKLEELSCKNNKLSFIDTYCKISELIETEEDYQDLHELLEKLQRRKLGKEQKEEQEDRQKILKEK